MQAPKSQGSKRGVLLASTLLLVAIVAAATFLTESGERPEGDPFPAASALQPLLNRCDSPPTIEQKDGVVQTRCMSQTHPAFAITLDSNDGGLQEVKLLLALGGADERAAERRQLGLEMFGLCAGRSADDVLPPAELNRVGEEPTRFSRDGLVYSTVPSEHSLVFIVERAD